MFRENSLFVVLLVSFLRGRGGWRTRAWLIFFFLTKGFPPVALYIVSR